MAKAFSTVRLLKGKEPFFRRMVCEIRYRDGQLYLDHTGRLLKKLVGDPAWVISPDPTTQGTTAYHLVEGMRLGFSMHSASLDLDRSQSDELIDSDEAAQYIIRADQTLGFVADELEVTEFERIGFRQWYYFSFDSKEESEQWLLALGLFSFSPSLLGSFKAVTEGLGVSLMLQGEDCHYRIGLNGIERSAQLPMGETNLNIRASAVSKNQKKALIAALQQKRQKQIDSSFAIVLDIDTYRIDPEELELTPFLEECLQGNLERFRNSLPKENGKKGR